jgi:hypothetical protein
MGPAVATVILLVMFLAVGYTNTLGRLVLSMFALSGFCFLALAPSSLSRRNRHIKLAAATLVVLAVAFLLVTVGIWVTPGLDIFWKATLIGVVLSVAFCYASWSLQVQPKSIGRRRVLRAAVIVSGLVAVLSVTGIIAELREEWYWWTVVLMVMIGGILAPVISR